MPNTFTFNEDLSCRVVSEDGLSQIGLPSYNPSTQVLWRTEGHVRDWVDSNANLTWTLISSLPTQEEQDAITATVSRNKRDDLIAATDWWASSDLTMTDEQTAYRQALRDITAHEDWPILDDADWPTAP